MSQSLSVRYRPQEFKDVCGQKSVITILQNQIDSNSFGHCYLFCGPSGCGKTTLGRILAKQINKGLGEPIEIDGASNNGVDNVRNIISEAKQRAIDGGEYKVYIIDECHSISGAGWNAFLKTIEEPPEKTIFIFCTTDPQKVPATIQNRVIKFNLTKIPTKLIQQRLTYICKQEGYTNYEESVDLIAKLSGGGLRDAIVLLEKASSFSTDLNITNTLQALGNFSYETMFDLTNALIDGNQQLILSIIDKLYDSGNDLKLFVETYLDFVLDLNKYCIFQDMSVVKIPLSMEAVKQPDGNPDPRCVKFATGIDNNVSYYNWLVDKILNIKNMIRYDSNIKTTIEILLIDIARGQR